MQWLQYLLILLCPLMMFFCMKGMGGGHHGHDMDKKLSLLQEENKKLLREVENLSKIVKNES